jgi:hypothetical protein
LEAELDAYIRTSPVHIEDDADEVPQEVQERLKSLGYLP